MSEKIIFETAQRTQTLAARAIMALTDQGRFAQNFATASSIISEANKLSTLLLQFSDAYLRYSGFDGDDLKNPTDMRSSTIHFLINMRYIITENIRDALEPGAPYQVRRCLTDIETYLERLESPQPAGSPHQHFTVIQDLTAR